MDFSLSTEQKELQSVAREFAQKEMSSVAKTLEEKKEPLSEEWFLRYSEMGFLGINIKKEYGGLGLTNLDALLDNYFHLKSCIFMIFVSFGCSESQKPSNLPLQGEICRKTC